MTEFVREGVPTGEALSQEVTDAQEVAPEAPTAEDLESQMGALETDLGAISEYLSTLQNESILAQAEQAGLIKSEIMGLTNKLFRRIVDRFHGLPKESKAPYLDQYLEVVHQMVALNNESGAEDTPGQSSQSNGNGTGTSGSHPGRIAREDHKRKQRAAAASVEAWNRKNRPGDGGDTREKYIQAGIIKPENNEAVSEKPIAEAVPVPETEVTDSVDTFFALPDIVQTLEDYFGDDAESKEKVQQLVKDKLTDLQERYPTANNVYAPEQIRNMFEEALEEMTA